LLIEKAGVGWYNFCAFKFNCGGIMHLKNQRFSALFIFFMILGMVSAPAVSAAEASPEDVLATIGSTKITRDIFEKELETFLASADPKAAAHFASPEGKKMFLQQISEIYALEALANKMGVGSGEDFEKSVHEIAVSRVAQEEMQKAVGKSQKISDKDARKYYDANKASFTEPGSYHIFQIAVNSAQKAAEIKKDLDAGKSFLELAKKESTDDFKEAGGDQGFVPENAISPVVLATLDQLKKDEVSAPLRVAEDNFLLVKYADKKEGNVKKYSAVSAQISRELESNKQREAYEAEIERLKKELGFKLNEEALKLFKKDSLSEEEKQQTLFSYSDKEVKVEELEQELQQIPPFLRPQILAGQGLMDIINNFSARMLAIENAEKNFDQLAEKYSDIIEDSRRRVVIKKLLDDKIGSITLTDKEIEEYYNKNLAQFSAPAQMNAHHILVKEEDEAKKILAQLKEDPEKFEAIAREKSTCPSGKSSGGDLGMFGEGQMVPEFDKACKEAEIGKIIGPVKTQFGYHIIRVNERQEAGTKKLEEVKDKIRDTLLPEKQKEAFTKLVDEVKKEFNVTLHEDKL
jgi:peptidyl-prolyl cis-trans isomerase C